MPENNRIEMIRESLEKTFTPVELDIIDESHLHVGHTGHGGAGHFQVHVVSAEFNNKSMIECHRMIYAALDNLMQTEIHALSIKANGTDKNT